MQRALTHDDRILELIPEGDPEHATSPSLIWRDAPDEVMIDWTWNGVDFDAFVPPPPSPLTAEELWSILEAKSVVAPEDRPIDKPLRIEPI